MKDTGDTLRIVGIHRGRPLTGSIARKRLAFSNQGAWATPVALSHDGASKLPMDIEPRAGESLPPKPNRARKQETGARMST